MNWIYQDNQYETAPVNYTGFVYIITNLITSKQYIGQKQFYFLKTKIIKGKKKKVKIESDWQTYYGSNEQLKADVERLGKQNFKREILHLCLNKGTANYLETKEQFMNGVLEYGDKFYNSIINCRIHRKHLRFESPKC